MYNLDGAIVNLRSAGVSLKCVGLDGNIVYAYNLRDNSKVALDVMSGVVSDTARGFDDFAVPGERHFNGNWNPEVNSEWIDAFEREYENFRSDKPELKDVDFTHWVVLHDSEFKRTILPVVEARLNAGSESTKTFSDSNAIRVLGALASHQSTGDEMTKGLKALNINVPVKIQESYLGGWNIPDYTIETLLETMFNQRA